MAADSGLVGDSVAVQFPIVRVINVWWILRNLIVELPLTHINQGTKGGEYDP
jgi:hypothetical protein